MPLDGARRVPQVRAHAVTVREVMVPSAQATVVGPDSPLADLLSRMEPGAEYRVVDDGRLVGIVSLSDVSRAVVWPMDTSPGGAVARARGPAPPGRLQRAGVHLDPVAPFPDKHGPGGLSGMVRAPG
ncbi:CBS domain-containing protein [Streptomyces sp. NPDC050388]|uniref:CBS domain-containing protein n=1 Tax=Streptomyces sp. NPDC050388 TaxID=3155781 RepID=UPI003429CA73